LKIFCEALAYLLRRVQIFLQTEKREKFRRRVPFGDLVTDRWLNATEYGFGEGTSCYDSVVVLGDVSVGKNCWIGPNCVLDGSGELVLGDNVVVGVGSVVFSHSSLERDLSGGALPIEKSKTIIEDYCRLAPYVVVEMGVTIGRGSILQAHSVVTKSVPAYSIVTGNPAEVVGEVQIRVK
jgi:acetyltransferase-like isoleucine patch superfamily enzyme